MVLSNSSYVKFLSSIRNRALRATMPCVSDSQLIERQDVARWAALQCGQCGCKIPAQEPVYLVRAWSPAQGRYQHTTRNVPICKRCHDPEDDFREATCEGCGRTVFRTFWTRRPGARVACSQSCRRKLHAALRRAKSGRREKTCTVCGQSFLAARSDALTCSQACRQKAYRQRLAAK